MAKEKDPAFLFYPEKFMNGVFFMTDEQAGKYIKLLCHEHQNGGLIDKVDFENFVGDDNKLRAKFIETEDGFFNEKLMKEIEKRTKKSATLSANAMKRWEIHKQKQCKSIINEDTNAMHTKDINKDVSKTSKNTKFKKPTLLEVKEYCAERQNSIDFIRFIDYYEKNGWKVGKNKSPMKDWKAAIRIWEKKDYGDHDENGKPDPEQSKIIKNLVNACEA